MMDERKELIRIPDMAYLGVIVTGTTAGQTVTWGQ